MHHEQVGLTVCGDRWNGENIQNCERFSNGQWRVSHNLLQRRYSHSMWQSPEGILLMGGTKSPNTTELLQDDGTSVHKFTLPYNLEYVVSVS